MAAAQMVAGAANVALNAVVAANQAVDGGAAGPHVQTFMRPPPLQIVRVFGFDFADYFVDGYDGLLDLQAARPYFEELINTHLPFNVAVEVVFNTVDEADIPGLFYVIIPPITCAGGFANTHDWMTFIARMRGQVEERVNNALANGSGWSIESIKSVKLTFAPLRDMAAVGPHIAPANAGGSYVPHPKWIKDKHCMLNIQNKDYQCFRAHLLAHELQTYRDRYGLSNPWNWSHYTKNPIPPGRKPRGFKVQYSETDLDFSTVPADRSMPVSLIRDWEEANGNRIGVYVYQVCHVGLMGAGDEWVTLLRRPPGHIKFEDEVKLLLYQGHYSLILDFQKLICRRHMTIHSYGGHTATMACHRCFRYFKQKEKLQAHLARWDCVDDSLPYKAEKSLPKANEDGSPAMDAFKKYQHLLYHQCLVPADFETNWNPADKHTKQGEKTLLLGRNKQVISAAYSAVGSEGFEVPPEHQMWLYRGPDPVKIFLINLLKLYRVYYEAKSNPKKIIMTEIDVQVHTSATRCGYCNSEFKSSGPLVKCADHNHFTGAYRTAACSSCNSKARLSNDIIVLFHNGGGYDFHFIIRAIADLQASEIGEMTIHEFNTGVAAPDKKMKIKDMEVQVIAKTAERYMEIRFGPLLFRDSI